MWLWEKLKKRENIGWALAFSVFFFGLLGLWLDFYYDLNDDVLMKDILSGIYTGVPESRNVQMLFPLSWLLSCLYRLIPVVPWYGVFLCGCHALCIFLVTERTLKFCHSRPAKLLVLAVELFLMSAYFLRDLVFIQYTFTSAVLGTTAVFLVLTGKGSEKTLDFFRSCLPGILLAVIAFLLRSEMLLLLLPFLCTAGLFRWAEESRPVISKENVKKYFLTVGALFLGLAICQMLHILGYRDPGWQKFSAFFDNRTELYDFQTIPPYHDNREFYESIGMSESRQTLLENYNFGMDEDLDAEELRKVAEYAGSLKRERMDFWTACREALVNYRYRTFHGTDYPWNLLVIAMYIWILAATWKDFKFRYLWKLMFLGFVRTGIWMFILFRGRAPERITHSLYLVEFGILLALLLTVIRQKNGHSSFVVRIGTIAILGLLSLTALPGSLEKTWQEYRHREEININLQALQSYTGQRHECFYFLDVYSTVAYSEKMFVKNFPGSANYDLMGGWLVKSPLNQKKLEAFLIESMETAVLDREDVYVIVQEPESPKLPRLEEWLPAYYEERGYTVFLHKDDAVCIGNTEIFTVYSVEEKGR